MNDSCSLNVSKAIHCKKDNYEFVCMEPGSYIPELHATVMLLIAVLSCTFNGLLILAAVKTKTTNTNVRILTITLAVAYSFLAGFILPIKSISVFYSQRVLPQGFCQIKPVITMFTFTLSQMSLLAISIDRYMSIHYPLTYPVFVTNVKLFVLLLSMCIVSLAASISQFFNMKEACVRIQSRPLCIHQWARKQETLIVILLIIVVPNIFIFVSYLKTSLLAKRHRKLIEIQKQVVSISSTQQHKSTKNSDLDTSCSKHQGQNNAGTLKHNRHNFDRCRDLWKELRIQKIILLSTGAKIVCWAPYISTVFRFLLYKDTVIPYSLQSVALLLANCNCWVTPMLILILSRKYRKCLKKLFKVANKRQRSID